MHVYSLEFYVSTVKGDLVVSVCLNISYFVGTCLNFCTGTQSSDLSEEAQNGAVIFVLNILHAYIHVTGTLLAWLVNTIAL